jgi:hypothetical protein
MVTSALWEDLNKDGRKDLVVAGEFMPITVYENNNGKLQNATIKYGLEKSNGVWSKLEAADMDNDGDMDIVAGNIGLNSQFRATEKEPVSICYDDFDNNGSIDPLLCYYIQGKQWPLASLDELAEQMPGVRKTFLRYEQYASATLENILTPQQVQKAHTVNAYVLTSSYLENKGTGGFTLKALPAAAQFSRVNAILIDDFNRDNNNDVILHGNDYSWRVQLGRMDASFGVVCTGTGRGNFEALPVTEVGAIADGDVRDMIRVKTSKGAVFISSKNNGSIEVKQMKQHPAL